MVYFFYHLDYEAGPVPVPDPAPEPESVPQPTQNLFGQQNQFWPRDDFGQQLAIEPENILATPRRSKKGKKIKKTMRATTPDLVMHAKVFAVAIKYHIPTLRELAATKFAAVLDDSEDHGAIAEAARVAYTTTDDDTRDLRDVVVDALHASPQLLDKESINRVVRDVDGLGTELLRKAHGMSVVFRGEKDEVPAEVPVEVPGF